MDCTNATADEPANCNHEAWHGVTPQRGTWVGRADGAVGRLRAGFGARATAAFFDSKGGENPGGADCVEVRWGTDGSVNVVEAAALVPTAGGTSGDEGWEALTAEQRRSCRWLHVTVGCQQIQLSGML